MNEEHEEIVDGLLQKLEELSSEIQKIISLTPVVNAHYLDLRNIRDSLDLASLKVKRMKKNLYES